MRPVSRKPVEAAPARMGPLAKLPIFLDLAGKRAVIAGGTAATAWKAELLAAAGANVEVFAATLSEEMSSLIERGSSSGSIVLMPHAWTPAALRGAAVALADAEDEHEAAHFAAAARDAGVPCNVIDKPAFCQFQFGSIVNRSPIVIGISTDGAAPILGQAIRRRIETLLPPALALWGSLARSLRAVVNDRLPNGPLRRAFWETFAERAFGGFPQADAKSAFTAIASNLSEPSRKKQGRVTLVGAGPGDAELLTIKAVRTMQAADVILYDDLVSDNVLELARREAKRILVGKRGQRDSCSQQDINDLMVKLANQGKHVVRLKSGDPMIFGRAGEEIDRLEREGIAVTVVPGVTSASAMASELGISLTHRDSARSVRFITGHAQSGELPDDLDWHGLSDPRTTLVVYMGARTSSALATRLMAASLDPATPVVALSSASRSNARMWKANLTTLAAEGVPSALENPVLIGIGAAFARAKMSKGVCDIGRCQSESGQATATAFRA